MNHLMRELAPITEAAWQRIDDEARTHLSAGPAARSAHGGLALGTDATAYVYLKESFTFRVVEPNAVVTLAD